MKPLIPMLGLLALVSSSSATAFGMVAPIHHAAIPDVRVAGSLKLNASDASTANAEDCERRVRSGRVPMATRPSEQKAMLDDCVASLASSDRNVATAVTNAAAENAAPATPEPLEDQAVAPLDASATAAPNVRDHDLIVAPAHVSAAATAETGAPKLGESAVAAVAPDVD